MEPNFNINRPKISDEEIKQHKDFDKLVKQFKESSLKQAQGDESWWKNKKVRYSTVIAGVTVICTITYLSLFTNQKQKQKHETIITSASTKNNTKTAPFVNAPSSKLKVPYSAYSINNAKGGNITHPTSTRIKIPKNSFVNKQGKEVIGDVTIEYREFHDLAEIIGSGIPMQYDSAGKRYHFESAGMFDIKGSQNGEPVYIKADKTISVEMASNNNESRFNQYALDTIAKNWQFIKKDLPLPANATTNESAQTKKPDVVPAAVTKHLLELKNQVEVILPKRIDSVANHYTRKVAQLPVVKAPNKPSSPTKGRPSFKLDGSYNEFPELAAFDNVVFEVGPENTNYSPELHEVTWSDVKVSQGPVKGKNYFLNLSYRNRTEKLVVYPVLSGVDLEKAKSLYENKFAEYEALAEKHKAAEQKLMAEMQAKQLQYVNALKQKQEAYDREKINALVMQQKKKRNELANNFRNMSNSVKASRLFSVSQFGIFNSDCPHSVPEGKSLRPVFVTGSEGNFLVPDFIYLVDHQSKSVYNLNANDGFTLAFTPGNPYTICIFKGNALYLCSKSDFQKTEATGSNKFMVKQLPQESENLSDFRKALEI